MGIQEDLKRGRIGEIQVVEVLKKHGFKCQLNENKHTNYKYDINACYNNNCGTIEVKYDIYSLKSGNIAIETFNPKSQKHSGINSTQADLWCHISDQIYITSVQKLKQYVKKQTPYRIIDKGGDNNATLFLYKSHIILPSIFYQINDISTERIIQIWRQLVNGV